ncbi:MAG: ABC transporter substrate-binding protein, partial [Rhodobacterales bacterium]|nr:ABC transporter substrate-binding protein [Rhodobacterales bacterium]
FSFASNQHPIQSIYARQVIQEGDVFTNKVLSMVLENHSNAYVDECKM